MAVTSTTAAVVSLKRKIVRLLNPSQSKINLPRSELESICEDLYYWQLFLQTISSGQSNDSANALQTQIEDLAHNFECVIESYTSDWNRAESESWVDVNIAFGFFQEIVQFKSKINSLTKTLESEKENHKTNNQRSSSSFVAESDTTKMVGLVDALEELKRRVFEGDHRIISIVGMAGIGKTTLAKELYYNPVCQDRFELRLFLTVGPRYQSRQFLLLALGQLGFPINETSEKKFAELKEHLLHLLYDKMFLIVLDDVWDTQVWHEIRQLFPNKNIGSRIIMTTRLLNVAGHPSCNLTVPFMNAHESWKLLCRMVFTRDQESSLWDHQLEKIGRKIAKNCEGLPLAIIEVGKILCKTERTVESWMEIAEREDPLVIKIDDGTPISNTLSLSYIKLPPHLKSCFMYMGVFRKNHEIPTIKLINLWISEGFITQPSLSNKSLEKVAEGCLDDLVSRSLVLVCKGSSSGRIKTCRIHFAYRNICISAAKKEKLFDVIKKYPISFPEGQRGLCFHNNSVLGFKQVHNNLLESDSDPHSLLVFGPQHQHPLRLYLHFPLLRVLDAVTIRFYKFPHQVVELVELRYLAITYDREIPPSISALCDLEVLIVRRHHESLKYSEAPVYLPMEIWKLQKLRHLQCMGYDLRDPSKEYGFDGFVTLENLSTLSGVSAHSCNRGVLERIPNLMKLVIRIESPDNVIEISDLFRHLRLLKCLESFKCVVNPIIGSQVVAIASYFPTNIRKITLSGCGFSWHDMTYIGSIPNLQVLKLRRSAFRGAEWATNEYEFTGLEVLLLEDLDIEHWITHPRHFPNLRCLIIRHCYKLREIPRRRLECFSTLEMIEVDDCRPSLVISARKIQKQQQKIPKKQQQWIPEIPSSELEWLSSLEMLEVDDCWTSLEISDPSWFELRQRIRKLSLEKKSLELRIHHSLDDKRLKP